MRTISALLLILLASATAVAAPPKRTSHRMRQAHAQSQDPAARPRNPGTTAPAEVRFLGHDPIVPLATARQGRLFSPENTACHRWGPVGSRWREIDAYGRVTGEVVVTKMVRYPVNPCEELSVRRTRGRPGAGVYVAVSAPYTAPNYEVWFPSTHARTLLHRQVEGYQFDIALLDPDHRVPFAKRSLFFSKREGKTTRRWAAIGGRSLVISQWNGKEWEYEHTFQFKSGRALEDALRPLAVTDMNGDGEPEVVVHVLQEWGHFDGELTFSRGHDGDWHELTPGNYGSPTYL